MMVIAVARMQWFVYLTHGGFATDCKHALPDGVVLWYQPDFIG